MFLGINIYQPKQSNVSLHCEQGIYSESILEERKMVAFWKSSCAVEENPSQEADLITLTVVKENDASSTTSANSPPPQPPTEQNVNPGMAKVSSEHKPNSVQARTSNK